MKAIIIEEGEYADLNNKIDLILKRLEELSEIVSSDDRLYNIKEAAVKLGIARQTLHNYINLGVVTEYITKGNRIYFTQESIETIKKAKV